MQHNIEIGLLLDCYSSLLTDRQSSALSLHYNDDYSLAEIAGSMNVSRQAVHDMIKKAENKLLEYEKDMGQLKRYLFMTKYLDDAIDILSGIEDKSAKAKISAAIGKLNDAKDFWEDN